MRMSMSGRIGAVPKNVGCCLAGLLAICSLPGISAAQQDVHFVGPADATQRGDATQPAVATQPTAPVETQPAAVAPSTIPTLVPHDRSEQVGDVSRTDQGEIVPLEESKHGPLTFSLQALYMYGSLGGTAQTPQSGVKRSATPGRPTMAELGTDSINGFDGEFSVHFDPNQEVFIGVEHLHDSATRLRTSSLIFKGTTFPVGTRVSSDVRFDWYRLGYRYNFNLDTAPNGVPDLVLSPFVDVLYWDNGIQLQANGIGSVGNPQTKWGFQIGGTIAWRPFGGPLSIEGSLAGFPQSSRLANVSTESILARYHFYRWHRVDMNFILGVLWEQQQYNNQRTPLANNIRINMGPMLLTGLQFNF